MHNALIKLSLKETNNLIKKQSLLEEEIRMTNRQIQDVHHHLFLGNAHKNNIEVPFKKKPNSRQ